MKKNTNSLLSVLLLIGIIAFIFYRMMPQDYSRASEPLTTFSTERALKHVAVISKQPHYVGSPYHASVLNYLTDELQKLGLETQIQESAVLSKWNNLVETKNLIARIKGSESSKALVLLTHYDSAAHSKSYGASDDANGLATILEGIRVFLYNKTPFKNDIIIVFSDAEELGLNGAYAFVSEHPWAKDVGLVLNFEARGTKGPSMMLAETNGGNSGLIKGFSAAKTAFPVSNSLLYSIYKMLPNDTDLTAFREKGGIPGFNFAYIDDHFDYHTVQDNFENFTPQCLEHQATYLMPLLAYFSNADLTQLKSDDDHVYFSVPYGFIHYPFKWNLPLFVVAFILFVGFVVLGIGKRLLSLREIARGFVPLFATLLLSGLVTFLSWKVIKALYPEYQDMLHGFTYNGHSYLATFVFLTLAFCFWIYAKFTSSKTALSHFVAPLFLWLVLNLVVVLFLEGAAFFIIPAYFGIALLAITVLRSKSSAWLNLLLSIPVLVILVPLVKLFPVGLGLKMLPGSSVLVVLLFALLLPIVGAFSKKQSWGWLWFIIAFGFFVKAHLESGFENGKGKPNSLIYLVDANQNKNYWVTYDRVLDSWTKNYLGENPHDASLLNGSATGGKYNSGFSFLTEAPSKKIPEPTFTFLKDTVIGFYRSIVIEIKANRPVQRMDVFAHENLIFHNLKANGVQNINQKGSLYKRKKANVLNY